MNLLKPSPNLLVNRLCCQISQITKALPGRTDNAIKNRFNAACRNHSLLIAAATAAGSAPREISLYEALHIHDTKTPAAEKPANTSKISNVHATSADHADVMRRGESVYVLPSGTANPKFSPLGTRSYSPPNGINVSSKYQRVDLGSQQQQQYLQHQKQQQMFQQEQFLQLHMVRMQQQQQQQQQINLQHMQQQQRTMQQFTASFHVPSSGTPYYPRPASNSSVQQSSAEYRQVGLTNNADFDMPITPELFDRIALSNIPRNDPIPRTTHPIIQTEPVRQQEYIGAARVLTGSSSDGMGVGSIISSDDVIAVSYEDSDDATAANRSNFNDGPVVSTINNAGQFIDFDESIFDDWMSDDTEMDFIEIEESKKPSVYDYLPSGCIPSRPGICSNDDTPRNSNTSAYAQNTNGICCGFSTAHSFEGNKQHHYPGQQQYVMPQVQVNIHPSVPLGKPKSTGFGSSIRALGSRLCGPGHVDSSFQQVGTVYDSKVYNGPPVMKQEGYRIPTSSVLNGGLTSMYGQNALREQYAKSRAKLDNNTGSGMSAGSTYSLSQSQGYREGNKNAFTPHYGGQPSTSSPNSAASSYTNPAHCFANLHSNNIPPEESSMRSYADKNRPQSIGHC